MIQQRRNQSLELQLESLLQTDADKQVEALIGDIGNLLFYFEGDDNEMEDQHKSSIEPSRACLKVMERALLSEIDAFY